MLLCVSLLALITVLVWLDDGDGSSRPDDKH